MPRRIAESPRLASVAAKLLNVAPGDTKGPDAAKTRQLRRFQTRRNPDTRSGGTEQGGLKWFGVGTVRLVLLETTLRGGFGQFCL